MIPGMGVWLGLGALVLLTALLALVLHARHAKERARAHQAMLEARADARKRLPGANSFFDSGWQFNERPQVRATPAHTDNGVWKRPTEEATE